MKMKTHPKESQIVASIKTWGEKIHMIESVWIIWRMTLYRFFVCTNINQSMSTSTINLIQCFKSNSQNTELGKKKKT